MDSRERSRTLTRAGRKLINSMPELAYIRDSAVRIVFLTSELEKKKGSRLVFGQCEKVPEKYKWKIPYDFMITVFLPNVERWEREKIRILLFHELLHVGIEEDGNEEKYSVREHDYEEFREIISRYGLDWSADDEA